MIGPHLAREDVIFAIAERHRRAAWAMGREAEANGIALNFDPQVTTSRAGTPAHQHYCIVFGKGCAPLQGIGIERFEHLRQPALPHDAPRVLFFSCAPRLVRLLAQDIFLVYVILARKYPLLWSRACRRP